MKTDPKIIVAIRKRPLTTNELKKNEKDIVEVDSNSTLIVEELRFLNKAQSRYV